MKKKVLTFNEFNHISEQAGATGDETVRQKKSRIAKSLVTSLLGEIGLTGSTDNNIEVTKEVKSFLPYKGCGATEPYKIKKIPITLNALNGMIEYSNEKGYGDYTNSLKELSEGRALIIGLRNKLSVKKETINQDRFIDALYFIPQNAKGSDEFVPYQITTVPSLVYYGNEPINPNGTSIKLPGETLYYYKEWTLGGSKYKMMVEGEEIAYGTYDIGTTKFETYKPSTQSKGRCGMHIHKSSEKTGICVGPWSAGCQVFADGTEWKDFVSKVEKQTLNSSKFYYALLEYDSINPVINDIIAGKLIDKSDTSSLSFDEDEYEEMSTELLNAFSGAGTNNDTIKKIISKLKNKADWNKLNKVFGTRETTSKFSSYKNDLKGWLSNELDSDEKKEIDDILKKLEKTV